jgi:serine/threonine protein kinase
LVALKSLRATDASTLLRFRQEAACLRRIDHPRVVKLLDAISGGAGAPVLVLEYLAGDNLEEVVRRENASGIPVEITERVRWFIQACEAVSAVHQEGVIHRDIKPSNFVVTEKGLVLVDFGVSLDEQSNATRQTRTGDWVGTVHFMAPELFDGSAATVQSDVLALGRLLQFMLLGEIQSSVAVQRLRASSVPGALTAAIIRANDPLPERRFGSVAELAEAAAAACHQSEGRLVIQDDARFWVPNGDPRPNRTIPERLVEGVASAPTPFAQAIERLGQPAALDSRNALKVGAWIARNLACLVIAGRTANNRRAVSQWLTKLQTGLNGIEGDLALVEELAVDSDRSNWRWEAHENIRRILEQMESTTSDHREALLAIAADVGDWAARNVELTLCPDPKIASGIRLIGISPSWWSAEPMGCPSAGYFLRARDERWLQSSLHRQKREGLAPTAPIETSRDHRVVFGGVLSSLDTERVPLDDVLRSL